MRYNVSNILNRYYAVVTATTRLKFDRRAIPCVEWESNESRTEVAVALQM